MLRAKDLMIGDWAYIYHPTQERTPVKVDGVWIETIEHIDNGLTREDSPMFRIVEPVPLTPEILEKNGFTKSERYEVWKIISDDYELRITPWRVAVIFLDEDGSDKEEFSAPRPKYLHELQRALRCVGLFELANNIKL